MPRWAAAKPQHHRGMRGLCRSEWTRSRGNRSVPDLCIGRRSDTTNSMNPHGRWPLPVSRAAGLCLGLMGMLTQPGALLQAQDFSKLRISEIHYNPQGTNGVDGEAFEFIELENTGPAELELGGVSFTGITATFLYPTVLGAGEFLVLARDPAHFTELYPGVVPDGSYVGKLDNAGETIRLLDPAGSVIT